MKIGVITFVNEDNYGAVLQAFAMQVYINQMGEECEFINVSLNNYNKNTYRFIEKIFTSLIFFRKKINFIKFRKKLSISENKNIDYDKYDVVIIGSDQVWNPFLTGGELQPVFFGEDFKGIKIAYACSCGNCNVLEGKEKKIFQLLQNIDYLSVREKSLEEYLNKFINKPIITVLDPVFLLDKSMWKKKLIKNFEVKGHKYIFVYILEENPSITAAINELSSVENLEVITLRTKKHYINEYKRYPGADPQRFLELLYAAEIIVTNSFHALAFSYIFRKKIALFKHSKFNERIENLLKILNVENSYYTNTKSVLDFSTVEEATDFTRLKSISKEFLDEGISKNCNYGKTN